MKKNELAQLSELFILKIEPCRLCTLFPQICRMRLFVGSILIATAIGASFIYRDMSLAGRIDEVIETEAVGWVVPMNGGGFREPTIWFSTELGNGEISTRPKDYFALGSLLHFSLDDGENQLAMKVLQSSTVLSRLKQWSIMDGAEDWIVQASLEVNGRPLQPVVEEIYIDLSEDDIVLPPSMFEIFNAEFPADSIQIVDSRLVVACAELQHLTSTGLTVFLGEVPIKVRKMSDLDEKWAELKLSGSCLMNVVFDEDSPVLGRAILEQYDLVFDALHGRVLVMPKSYMRPDSPLEKFRLDEDFQSHSDSVTWRWIRSQGPVTWADFIFTEINEIERSFEIICLRGPCSDSLLPRGDMGWVGSPSINVQTDMVTVSDQHGWISYDLSVMRGLDRVSMSFTKKGYRMKRDSLAYVEGERIELIPVTGSKQRGEFTVSDWPPVQDGRIPIVDMVLDDLLVYLPKYQRFHGKPRFEITPEPRVVITAEPGDMECAREIRIATKPDGRYFWDFSAEICRYRQVDFGESGYAFELSRRSQGTVDEIILQHEAGDFDFKIFGGFSLFASHVSGSLGSSKVRWMAEPVLAFDPGTKRVTITPTGEKGWEYSHAWESKQNGAASLDFYPLPIRLQVPPTKAHSAHPWYFVPADAEYTGPVVYITKSNWLMRDSDGSFTITFEQVKGPLFTGREIELFEGLPIPALEETGRLSLRSNGDSRIQFYVLLRAGLNEEFEIEFRPTEFAAVGSFPAVVDSPGHACTICQEDLMKDEVAAETFCHHLFHIECLTQMERKECPNCRASLDFVKNA